MFLDKHTPEGLFDPRTDCGRALVAPYGDEKIAIFFEGEGPKFRHQVLNDDKIAFGRWYPLKAVINNDEEDGEPGASEIGVIEVEDGIVRMLALWASGQPVWMSIGVSEADDALIDNYDLIAEGWCEPFASRQAEDDNPAQVFEWHEPLLSSFTFNISE